MQRKNGYSLLNISNNPHLFLLFANIKQYGGFHQYIYLSIHFVMVNWSMVKMIDREALVIASLNHLQWRSLQQNRADIRLVVLYKTTWHSRLDLIPQFIPFAIPSRHSHSEAFQLPLINKQFIHFRFLPR